MDFPFFNTKDTFSLKSIKKWEFDKSLDYSKLKLLFWKGLKEKIPITFNLKFYFSVVKIDNSFAKSQNYFSYSYRQSAF